MKREQNCVNTLQSHVQRAHAENLNFAYILQFGGGAAPGGITPYHLTWIFARLYTKTEVNIWVIIGRMSVLLRVYTQTEVIICLVLLKKLPK